MASTRCQESRAQSGLVPVPALGTPQTVCHIEWPPLHPVDKRQLWQYQHGTMVKLGIESTSGPLPPSTTVRCERESEVPTYPQGGWLASRVRVKLTPPQRLQVDQSRDLSDAGLIWRSACSEYQIRRRGRWGLPGPREGWYGYLGTGCLLSRWSRDIIAEIQWLGRQPQLLPTQIQDPSAAKQTAFCEWWGLEGEIWNSWVCTQKRWKIEEWLRYY